MARTLSTRRLTATCVTACVVTCLICCSGAAADYAVQACGSNPNFFVFAGSSSSSGIAVGARCPVGSFNGAGLSVSSSGTSTKGQAGRLQVNAPAGLELLGATADQIASVGVNDGGDWGGGFYWAGGGVATNDQTDQNPNVGMVFPAPSSYWGLQMVCGKATCSANALLAVQAVTLYVRETTPPNFAATGLWQASGWIRGSWPFFAWSDSPSGVCAISTTLNGLPIASTSSSSDTSYVFHQCAAPAINQTVDTSRYGNGALAARPDLKRCRRGSRLHLGHDRCRQSPAHCLAVRAGGRSLDGRHAIRDGDCVRRPFRCRWDLVLGRRRSRSVVFGELGAGTSERHGWPAPGAVLCGEQRGRSQRGAWDLGD